MRIIRPSSEDEMVLAFLRAEIDSPRQGIIARALSERGYTPAILNNADLGNSGENQARAHGLSCARGFRSNSYLFEGFPDNVIWQRISLSIEEVGRAKYINHDGFVETPGGKRSVADGVRNLEETGFPKETRSTIECIGAAVKQGSRLPEMIFVGESEDSGLILLEGHKRATAYVRAAALLPEGVEAIAGFSTDLRSWFWY